MPARPTRYATLLGFVAGDQRLAVLAEAALALRERGEPAQAERIYAGLALLAPNDPSAPLGLAELAADAGDWNVALRQARRAMHAWNCDREPMAAAAALRGKALAALGRVAEANRWLRIAAELEPDAARAT